MSAQPQSNRFENIDTLRGVAVLGILLMNVQAFAMYNTAYSYPPAHMDISGANLDVWFFSHVFFEMKFITIFSGLFGAGVLLMLGNDPNASTKIHYRRMLWLLLIGMIHAYVFWFGDILVSYALAGMLVVLARNMSARGLAIFGTILITVVGLIMVGAFSAFNLMPGGADPVEVGMAPTPEKLAETVAMYQAGFLDRMPYNAMNALFGQLTSLFLFGGRIVGVMFLGMALYKSGFLTLRWGLIHYVIAVLIGLGVGIPMAWWGGSHAIETGFALTETWKHVGANYIASLFMAFGYAATIMLICKIGIFNLLLKPFAAVGRMAFTNYLTHTLVMTFIFVGTPGLGLFGTVERVGQFQIVAAVWVAQLIISPIWLSWFRFGPMEWVWRSLTYGKMQPMLKRKSSEPTPPTPA